MKFFATTLVVLSLIFSPAFAAEKMVKRTIVFPQAFSLGRLYQFKDPQPGHVTPARVVVEGRGQVIGPARGKVTFLATPGSLIYLSASYELMTKPEVLRQLEPNGIDGLTFGSSGIVEELDKVYAPISHLTGLQVIDLNASEATDEQVKLFKPLVNLAVVYLSMCRLSGDCFKDLPMPKIRRLELSGNKLSPKAFVYISRYRTLDTLGVGNCQVTDAALVEIAKLKQLVSLAVPRSKITPRGLALIGKLPRLTTLNLEGTKLSARDLQLALKGLHLQSLILPSAKITPQELKALQGSFPAANLVVPQQVDREHIELFAPLH